jgi:hypothetical protein
MFKAACSSRCNVACSPREREHRAFFFKKFYPFSKTAQKKPKKEQNPNL